MSAQHTQGRLVVRDFKGSSDLEREDGLAIAAGLSATDARRLAACWNIAEGMATKEVEQGMPLVGVRDKINQQAQELAAARALLMAVIENENAAVFGPDVPNADISYRIRAFLKGGA